MLVGKIRNIILYIVIFLDNRPDDDTILDIKEEVADAIEDTQVMIHKGLSCDTFCGYVNGGC